MVETSWSQNLDLHYPEVTLDVLKVSGDNHGVTNGVSAIFVNVRVQTEEKQCVIIIILIKKEAE